MDHHSIWTTFQIRRLAAIAGEWDRQSRQCKTYTENLLKGTLDLVIECREFQTLVKVLLIATVNGAKEFSGLVEYCPKFKVQLVVTPPPYLSRDDRPSTQNQTAKCFW